MKATPHLRTSRKLTLAGSIALLVTFPVTFIRAGQIWDGGGAPDNNWNTLANWDSNTLPTSPGTLTFGGTGVTANNNLAATFTMTGLTFSAGAGAFTLTGNQVITSGTGAPHTNNSAVEQTINLPLSLTNSFTVGGGASMTYGGAITATGGRSLTNNLTAGTASYKGPLTITSASAASWTVSGASGANTVISGVISNGGAGAIEVITTGGNTTHTLTLTGANTFTGGLNAGVGRVKLDFSAAGAPTSDIVNSGLASGGSGLTGGGGTLELIGANAANNSQRFNTLTLTANRASAIRLTQNGAADLDLTFSGSTIRNVGTSLDFTLPSAGTVTFTSTNTSGANNVLSSSGGTAYGTVDGATWATNTAGVIAALGEGAYQADFTAATGDTTVTAATPTMSATTVNSLRFAEAGRTLTLAPNTVNVVTSGGILVTSAATGSEIAAGGVNSDLRPGGGKELVIINNADLTIGARLIDNAGSSVTIAGSPTSTTTLNGANTYANGTAVTGGTLILGNKDAAGAGTISLTGSSSTSGFTVGLQAGTALTGANAIPNAISVVANAIIGGSNALQLGGAVTLASSRTLTFNNTGGTTLSGNLNIGTGFTLTVNGSQAATFNGTTTANTGALTYSGTGSLTLATANSYTGATAVSSGTLTIAAANATSGVTVFNSGKLNINHVNALGTAALNYGSSTAFLATGSIDNTSGAPIVLANGLNITAAAAILTFDGTNDLTFQGAVATPGANRTIVANGSATLKIEGNIGASGFSTLNLQGNGSGWLSGVLSAATSSNRGIVKSGTGTWLLSGNNTFTGQTFVDGGTLLVSGSISGSNSTVSNAGSTLGGTGTVRNVTVNAGAVIQGGDGVNASGALTSGNDISINDGGLIKLTLGTGGTHASLARTGGTWRFDLDQVFQFNPGAEAGPYDNIITGLSGSEIGLATINTWTALNYAGSTFTFDGTNVDLVLVPEPGTAMSLLGGLGMLAGLQRFRRRRA